MATLARLPLSTWGRALVIAVVVYLVIGLPTDIVPNPVFGRSSIPVRWWDPPMLAVSALLMGLVLAIRPVDNGDDMTDEVDEHDKRAMFAGIVSLFAVGCPTCNHLVVLLLGTSGALSAFQPLQPIFGLASMALLTYTLRRRISDLSRSACPIS